MKLIPYIKALCVTSYFISVILFSSLAHAHSRGATLGADGTNASATGLAAITCFDDGNGQPAGLLTQIKDLSTPVPGLLISVQLYKGTNATNTTDTVSGDADFSRVVQLNGGPGVYWIIVNKTDVGPRSFEVIYHCVTSENIHTGTDTLLRQFQ